MKRPFFWGVVAGPLLRALLPRALFQSPMQVAARHPWLTLGFLGTAAMVGALVVATSGLVTIAASRGHWRVTEWFLQYSKDRAIQTQSLLITVPPLDDEGLVQRGAGHYDLGCRACHGGPGVTVPPLTQYMLPPPPNLAQRVTTRTPAQLFYVVKHGIKMTGMPAWPSVTEREDEVWAVVAFLQRLPAMDAGEYLRLTRGEAATQPPSNPATQPPSTPATQPPSNPATQGEPLPLPSQPPVPDLITETCARCHGLDGLGRAPGAFPKLAGQRVDYLERALRAYATGMRHSGIMGPIAAAMTPESRSEAARYYAALPPPAPRSGGDAQRITRGAALALQGDPQRLIPACVECHGPSGPDRNPAYPRLAGQDARYLSQQLTLLQRRLRGGSEYVDLMHSFVGRLTPEHIDDVSAYFASATPD